MHAAAIPLRAALGAAGRGKVLEKARHRTGTPVLGEQVGPLVGCLPLALAAGDKDRLSGLVGKPVECALDRHLTAALLSYLRAGIGEHVRPPFLRDRLLPMRPGSTLACVTAR